MRKWRSSSTSREACYVLNNSVPEQTDHNLPWNRRYFLFILQLCALYRLLLLVLQFLFNLIMYDFPADAFKGMEPPKEQLSVLDLLIRQAFSGLLRWDSVHFLHIAQYGYSFESLLAFFPLFPYAIYNVTIMWSWSMPFIHFSTALIISALAMNNIAFLICGQLLYALSLILTKSIKVSLLICIVFAINPASIFFSSAYSESLFMTFTLSGLVVLYVSQNMRFVRYILASTFFALAFSTRSNGVLNFIYIAFQLLCETVYCAESRKYIWQLKFIPIFLKILRLCFCLIICWLIFCSLVRLHDFSMRKRFCSPSHANKSLSLVAEYIKPDESVLPGQVNRMPWCRYNQSRFNPIPTFYADVQSRYWDVRAFGYWKVRKIPCFLMAIPALFIVFYGLFGEIRLLQQSNSSLVATFLAICRDSTHIIPFCCHSLIISILALMLYNVEVGTRILFSSPYIYIILSRYMHNRTPLVTLDDVQYPWILPFFTNFCRTHIVHSLLLSYLFGYYLIGTLLHVNWLPFT